MNNACPGCGTLYNVSAKDVGRRLKCKKCSAPIRIGDAGIEPDPDPPTAPEPGPSLIATALDAIDRHGGLVASTVFGFGAFLVLFTLFMPVVGQAKLDGRKASVEEEQHGFDTLVEETKQNKDLSDGDRTKKLDVLQKEHDRESRRLRDRAKTAEFGLRQGGYWDGYLMLAGFVLVTVGSLLFLAPDQPVVRRVLGAVVLAAQLLLVFRTVLNRGG